MYLWNGRFNGRDFLTRFRGKKILFVGDSLSNNMWRSLSCMLHAAVPNANYTFQVSKLSTFTIPVRLAQAGILPLDVYLDSVFRLINYQLKLQQEFGISVNYLKNGFLVDLVADKARGLVLKLDSISTGNQWLGYDVAIFNTFHWWSHTGRAKTYVNFN